MRGKLRQGLIIFFGFILAFPEFGTSFENENIHGGLDMDVYQPLEDKVLNRLLETDDGPFERKIKKLLAEYLLASAVEAVTNGSSIEDEVVGRAVPQQNNYYPPPQPGQNIVYVYGTPPPLQNQNTQRTRRTKPPRTPRTPRTRRPGHHHQSSEERNTQPSQPVIQPVYVQAPPQYAPPPQYPPQQQQPPYYPQYQPQQQPAPQQQRPSDVPQDNLGSQSSSQQVPPQAQSPQNFTVPIQGAPPSPQQQPPAPVQVIYLQQTTPAGQTTTNGPTTTPRPRPSQEHVYNQVNKILDNVAVGNVTGIVDQALGIRTPMPTRNFVNGILNTVFCNPINRLLGRCRG